jgi:hypothetical protein
LINRTERSLEPISALLIKGRGRIEGRGAA